ncbi:MAG TPA: hypothetical protein PLE45_08840 [Spirochaetota bacterium]|nr:hypothetical protein [Spirochaetota bacterium]HOL57706.1 hypothetical protein [Spirochaetota bacterium]HPP04092.1 hypothetical protein [Spirochaetota bacterium]
MAKRFVKEIGEKELDQIFNAISENKEDALGWYYFKDLKILVYPSDISKKRYETVRRTFKKLREEGRCLYCSTIVTDINPHTQKPYCKCAVHRRLTALVLKRKKLLEENAPQEAIQEVEKELKEVKVLDKELRDKEKQRRKREREQFLNK